jgi:uncharacterized membrane protein (DUF485 family)
MQIVTLLLILFIGSLLSLPMAKNKYTKVIPRAIVLILIGIVLGGSNNITTNDQ